MRFFCKALFNNSSASETQVKNDLFKLFSLEIFWSEEGKSALLAAIIIGLDPRLICLLNKSKSFLSQFKGFLIKPTVLIAFLTAFSLIDKPESLLDMVNSILCFKFSLSLTILSQSFKIKEHIHKSNSFSTNSISDKGFPESKLTGFPSSSVEPDISITWLITSACR